jgi:hypothetical protein
VVLLFTEFDFFKTMLTLDEAIGTVSLVRFKILAENRKLAISAG